MSEQNDSNSIPVSFCIKVTIYTKCQLSAECILSATAVVITVFALYKLLKNKNTILFYKIMGGLSLTLFSISAVFHLGVFIVVISPDLCIIENALHGCGQTATIAYSVGMTLLYTLFYCRLKMVFAETQYAILSVSFYLFIFGSFLLIIPIPFVCYYYIIWHTNATLLAAIWQILYGTLSIILSIAFIVKSIKFIKSRFQSENKNRTLKEKKLFQAVIRYTILFIIALLSSLLEMIIFFYRWTVYDSWKLWILQGVVIILDNVTNIICLFFQFPFAQMYYQKYCCLCINIIYPVFGINSDEYDYTSTDVTRLSQLTTLTSINDKATTTF